MRARPATTTPARTIAAAATAVLLMLTAACGGDDDTAAESEGSPSVAQSAEPEPTSPAETSSPEPTTEPEPEGESVTFELVNGKPTERIPDVNLAKGDRFTLIAISDKAYEIHVHGYDESVHLKPGKEGRVSFVADKAGSWAVEVEETHSELFNLLVK